MDKVKLIVLNYVPKTERKEQLIAYIPKEEANGEEFIVDVDFGGVLLQIERTKEGLRVTNGVDGYGRNVKDEYKDAKVSIGLSATFFCDNKRHLVCVPYSIENLHKMAEELNIKRCWFHKDHYDIPKRRIKEIQEKCIVIDTRSLTKIVREGKEKFRLGSKRNSANR